ncbi:MAG TPA: trypsin-like peptidase domain-containing protein [Urbifossiella sp.]
MMLRRFARGIAPATAIALLILAPGPSLSAADPVSKELSKWEPLRTTIPDSVEELKALQAAVKKVIEKSTPATVGILIGMGAGSGVIVSEDGLVLTAAHVSGDPGKDCTIILPDGTRVKGKTLGTDDKMDSGMIQIVDKAPRNGKWPFIPLGKSSELKKGQWLVALGHPGGWKRDRPPVARLGQVQDASKDLVRSTCTLVGGDSGGPLFDLEGHIVGIHSRIGYTLASNIHVPSDIFKKEWERLVQGEQIGKPLKPATAILGVSFDEKAETPTIDGVSEEGPAEKAGLKGGDIIVEFDGKDVATADDIRAILRKKKPGDEVEVTIKRGAKTITKTVTLGKRDS